MSKQKVNHNWTKDYVLTPLRRLHGEAVKFCAKAHEGQKRKYTGDDYYLHPVRVSSLLSDYGYGDREPKIANSRHIYMMMAALLHDTVEDCEGVTHKIIYDKFGEEVGDLVFWLTDVSKPEDGNRALRKRLDRLHLFGASSDAQIIKCADLIDNTKSIVEHDPGFAKIYLEEKRLLLYGMSDYVKRTSIHIAAVELAHKYIKEL